MKFTAAITILFATTALAADATPRRLILPVVGSTAGAHGSNFKTELQLNNRSLQPMSGRIVFHPQGRSASAADPSLSYRLEPFETISFGDIIAAMETSGLGSMDIVLEHGGWPTVIARAFDDQGENGTVGATITAVRASEARGAGESSVLLTPADRDRFRFNVGVRTLEEGATLRITLRGMNGIERRVIEQQLYPAEYFIQLPVAEFVGEPVLGNESIEVAVLEGAAIIYGSMTDNITNDPSLQLAVPID
jgi:hypothetical protein